MTVDPSTKRKRGNTRRRLIDAAFEAYAENGFGHTTVEKVVDRAGFTRGAFYSNFESLEELFLEMWAERSSTILAEIRTALDRLVADDVVDLREVIRGISAALPLDPKWWGITAEVTAHALRTPGLREVVAAREEHVSEALTPLVVELLARAGRRIPDPESFSKAVIAVFDGTAPQCLLNPDDDQVLERRRVLFEHIALAYSVPDDSAAALAVEV
ncbi:MAG: TetR/AcrR family transcriptional regulator [Gordonia sp. (in: high G+C Gram-positive bacteria)]|uniref:TetR/AcrR family transcriptional regulator n=1 Tax=Gordonia sp. (in: high G+C Gram-positive bacteria) TaxID=84139 RepID=UPI0039E72534